MAFWNLLDFFDRFSASEKLLVEVLLRLGFVCEQGCRVVPVGIPRSLGLDRDFAQAEIFLQEHRVSIDRGWGRHLLGCVSDLR